MKENELQHVMALWVKTNHTCNESLCNFRYVHSFWINSCLSADHRLVGINISIFLQNCLHRFEKCVSGFLESSLWLCTWTFLTQYWSEMSPSGPKDGASLSRTSARNRPISSLILRVYSTRKSDKIIFPKTTHLLLISWPFKIASKSVR